MTLPPEKRDIAKHILPTAANLLGFCFVLLGYIQISDLADKSLLDEFLGVLVSLFLISCVFSYGSMRTGRKSELYERIADIIFLIGLTLLIVVSIVIFFHRV